MTKKFGIPVATPPQMIYNDPNMMIDSSSGHQMYNY